MRARGDRLDPVQGGAEVDRASRRGRAVQGAGIDGDAGKMVRDRLGPPLLRQVDLQGEREAERSRGTGEAVDSGVRAARDLPAAMGVRLLAQELQVAGEPRLIAVAEDLPASRGGREIDVRQDCGPGREALFGSDHESRLLS
ncbi:MAG: hypothetical protein ACE5GW_11270 [Planctomycetota bacterium]